MGPEPGTIRERNTVNMRTVRDHARKRDMPLLLVFCVLFIAVVREPSTCDRKIQKVRFICIFLCVCVCVCVPICIQLDKEHTSLIICGLTWELIIDGFIYSECCAVNLKLACVANEERFVFPDAIE